MLELVKKLFGKEATEEKLKQLAEVLERDFVLKSLFEEKEQELTALKEEQAKELEHVKQQAENEKFSMALQHALSRAGAKNAKAVQALLSMEGLRLENGTIMGLSEQLDVLKKENGYLFEDEKGRVHFVRPGGSADVAVTPEEFQKMGYMEKLKLKKEQPDLYQSLLKKAGGKLCRLI